MGNECNYRVGLIIQRNTYIDIITPEDIINFYQIPSKITFEPIFLNENTLPAYGFSKSDQEYNNSNYYSRNGIMIVMRPFTNKYYCPNIRFSSNFNYLHELQDFFETVMPFNYLKATYFQDFILRYGSRYLKICDT